eukprot:scaffold28.g7567.t1
MGARHDGQAVRELFGGGGTQAGGDSHRERQSQYAQELQAQIRAKEERQPSAGRRGSGGSGVGVGATDAWAGQTGAGMASFGGRAGDRDADKAAYRAELEAQMRDKEARKRQASWERQQQLEEQRKRQEADGGGGGGLRLGSGGYGGGSGPLRDEQGNVVADLNRVRRFQQEASLRRSLSPDPPQWQRARQGSEAPPFQAAPALARQGSMAQQPQQQQLWEVADRRGSAEAARWAGTAPPLPVLPGWQDAPTLLQQEKPPGWMPVATGGLEQQSQPPHPAVWGPRAGGAGGAAPAPLGGSGRGSGSGPQSVLEAGQEAVVVRMRSDRPLQTVGEAEQRARQQEQLKAALQEQVEEKRRAREAEAARRRAEEASEEARLAREQERLREQFEAEQAKQRAKAADKDKRGGAQTVEGDGLTIKFKPPPAAPGNSKAGSGSSAAPGSKAQQKREEARQAQLEQQERERAQQGGAPPPTRPGEPQAGPESEGTEGPRPGAPGAPPHAQRWSSGEGEELLPPPPPRRRPESGAGGGPGAWRSALARQQREIEELRERADHAELRRAGGAGALPALQPPWGPPLGWGPAPLLAAPGGYGYVPPGPYGYQPLQPVPWANAPPGPPPAWAAGPPLAQPPPPPRVPVYETAGTLRDWPASRPATGQLAAAVAACASAEAPPPPSATGPQDVAEQSMAGTSTLIYPRSAASGGAPARQPSAGGAVARPAAWTAPAGGTRLPPLPPLPQPQQQNVQVSVLGLPFSRESSVSGPQPVTGLGLATPGRRRDSHRPAPGGGGGVVLAAVKGGPPWTDDLVLQQNAAALAALRRLEGKRGAALEGELLDSFLMEVGRGDAGSRPHTSILAGWVP